jgi:hypothetical protein
METMKLEKKNKDIKKDNNQFRLDQSTGSATKTLEATGVRYEKSQSAGGEK